MTLTRHFLRRTTTTILLAYAVLLPAQACVNILREPARGKLTQSFNKIDEVFNGDSGVIRLQVGQQFELRIPAAAANGRWRAYFPSGATNTSISLEQTAPQTDDDGVVRQGIAVQAAANGDTAVMLEYLQDVSKEKSSKSGRAGKKLTEERKQTRMYFFTVEEVQTFVVPPRPHPLLLTAADAGKPMHTNYGEEIIVTLPHPDKLEGEWQLARNSNENAVYDYERLLTKKEAVGTDDAPANRFVINSMALKQSLNFEFVLKPSDSFLTNLFRSKIARTVSFDIKVYPAPVC